jgi:hypothetical protein
MPYAKIDVGFIREHFKTVPARDRAELVGFYTTLVLHSAEMLTDGEISRAVAVALGDSLGMKTAARRPSYVLQKCALLASVGLLSATEDGGYRIAQWQDHHSSRHEVEEARKAAAERQRKRRGQPQIPGVTALSQRDIRAPSQRDMDVTRAVARAQGTDSDSNEEQQTVVARPPAPAPARDAAPTDHHTYRKAETELGHDRYHEFAKLMACVTGADEGTAGVVAAACKKLPLARIAIVRETYQTRHAPAGKIVNALKNQEREYIQEINGAQAEIDDPEPSLK